jgi:hypothetical protein
LDVRDSDERFLQRLTTEAALLLGPGAVVRAIRSEPLAVGVRITAEWDTPAGPRTIQADGASLVDAAGRFIARLPEERLAFTFRRLVADPDPLSRP